LLHAFKLICPAEGLS